MIATTDAEALADSVFVAVRDYTTLAINRRTAHLTEQIDKRACIEPVAALMTRVDRLQQQLSSATARIASLEKKFGK